MRRTLSDLFGNTETLELVNFLLISVKWALITSVAICHLFRQQLRIIWLMLRLPGPPGHPITGHLIRYLDHKRFTEEHYTFIKIYGPVVRMWNFIFPTVLVADPNDVEKILGSSKHVEKPFYYSFLKNLLGDGLLTSEGMDISKEAKSRHISRIEVPNLSKSTSIWRNHRRAILPYFHVKNIEEHIPAFNKGSELLNNAFEDHLGKASNINITSLVNKTVFSILSESIFGLDLAFDDVDSMPYKESSNKFANRFLKPWLGLDFIYKRTNPAQKESDISNLRKSFTKRIIHERREMRQKGLLKNKCFLDFLLDISNENFTEEDCIREAGTFILAGQDSVATTIAFCLHQVANNPEVQEKIVTELDLIFGDSQRSPSASDVRKMIYLEQCIKETMRLYPPVPFLFRTLGEDVKVDNYVIPQGCTVLISPWLTNVLEESFPDPEIFNPDHFEPSKCEKRHPYAFLTFSAGPRNCIGYKFALIEMKVIISNVLRKYLLTPVPGKEKLNVTCRVLTRASGGVWIALTSRKAKNMDPKCG